MQLLALEHGQEWEPMSALRSDGVVEQWVNKRAPAGQFRLEGDRLLAADGTLKLSCTSDGRVVTEGTTTVLHFDAGDALVGDDGSRIFVSERGEVEVSFGRGRRPRSEIPLRVTGVSATTRRTAALLVLATIASIDWHFH